MHTRSHLGHLLHAGDVAMGFDVANANMVDMALEAAVHKVRLLPACL